MLSIYDMFIIYFHCYMLYILSFILDLNNHLITCLFNFYHIIDFELGQFKLLYIFIGSMVVFTMYYGCSTVVYNQDAFAIDIS